MQQPPHPSYYFSNSVFTDGGSGGPSSSWGNQEKPPPNHQWENNGNAYHLATGPNYSLGPGQVGGGGQARVPQQHPPPNQPPPTSTPPAMHGDIMKSQLPQGQPQLGFVPARPGNPGMVYSRSQQALQPAQLRSSISRGAVATQFVMGQPTLVHQPGYVNVYPQTRHYSPSVYMQQPQAYYANPQYFPPPIMYQPPPTPATTPQTQAQVQIMRTNIVPAPPVPPLTKTEPRKQRPNRLKIFHPDTKEEIALDDNTENNNFTPTRSNESSARETPQPPGSGGPLSMPENNTVAAEFAAMVAARVSESTPSISSLSVNVGDSDSETLHKQPPVSDRVISTLSLASEEFIPRANKIMIPPPNELIPSTVPTVSADTDSPHIEIQRPPVIMKHPSVSQSQSPPPRLAKKPKPAEVEQPEPISTPPLTQSEVKDTKKVSKPLQHEELPKERREKVRANVEQTPPLEVVIPNMVPVTPVPTQQVPTSAKEVRNQVAEVVSANKSQHLNGETVTTLRRDSVEVEPVAVPASTPVPVVTHTSAPSPIPAPVPKLAPAATPFTATVPSSVTQQPPDSNKSKRQVGKKSNKMRDLNRKGTEKEGSEMDAFTSEPSIMNEEKVKVLTPTNSRPHTPVPTPAPAVVPEPVDKIQEDLIEKEVDIVAAKNEENTKVSALRRPEPDPSPVVKEEEPPRPQITLRHSYSKDQWSPLNPEGKKKYDRDFLMNLRTDPLSERKPDNLPDVVISTVAGSNRNQNMYATFRQPPQGMGLMMPSFINNQQQRQAVGKRGSQQGSKKGSRVITMSLSDDVKLKRAEHAWKPTRLEDAVSKTEDEKETEELLKNVRGILNKLTPQKFDKLIVTFQKLKIDTETRLREVINLIFDKAVDEPSFSKAYALMCKQCSKTDVIKENENGEKEVVNFRKILITRCQIEFEKNKAAELDAEKWHEEINSCIDLEKRKEKKLAYEEKERLIRKKSVGNIRFIGELFKLKMLTPAIMHRCIEHLLGNPAEESLECLCKLLTTIGKELDTATTAMNKGQQGSVPSLNPYFQKMSDLSQRKGSTKVSSRVRFMLQDVIELRLKKWVPRREDNNPKTIEQINQEAAKESMDAKIALSQPPPPRQNRMNDRPDDRKNRNNRSQNDDGWNTVTTNNRYNNKFAPSSSAFESSRMMNVKDTDVSAVSLGGSSMFRFQTGHKSMEHKSGPFMSNNTFSALSRGDERKPPQANMNSRRVTPTPSIEKDKERLRMLQGSKENEGQRSRESSVPRSAPTQAPPAPKQQLTETELQRLKEKLERQSQTLIEEYLSGVSSVEDVRSEVEQMFSVQNCGEFIQKALDLSLEKKAPAQQKIGLLISTLLDSNIFTPDIVMEQFGNIYEISEDLAIDIPKVWDLQAQFIVPIFTAEKINFSHFKQACGTVLKSKTASLLLVPVLSLLRSEKGEGFVRSVWDSSNVDLKDFLPEEINVDTFIEEKSIKYLTGKPPKCEALPMDQVQDKILRLITSNQPYEKIIDFIKSYVGDKVEDTTFIHALVGAFCEACVTGSNYTLNVNKFKQYGKLIERFVDHKEERELACLSAVHALCCKLQHPQGLNLALFQELFDNSLISTESFLKWRDDKQISESKGVTVYSLASFFKVLGELETDEENS